MITADIDTRDLERAIQVLATMDDEDIEPEFRAAGERTAKALVRDLRGGVASRSGELRSSITGQVQTMSGASVDLLMSAGASNNGYDYPRRLDKDGRMHWRSGKFAGRRTFGWWSSTTKRNAPRIARREYTKAAERIVERLATRMG